MRFSWSIALTLATCLLSACGGGEDTSSDTILRRWKRDYDRSDRKGSENTSETIFDTPLKTEISHPSMDAPSKPAKAGEVDGKGEGSTEPEGELATRMRGPKQKKARKIAQNLATLAPISGIVLTTFAIAKGLLALGSIWSWPSNALLLAVAVVSKLKDPAISKLGADALLDWQVISCIVSDIVVNLLFAEKGSFFTAGILWGSKGAEHRPDARHNTHARWLSINLTSFGLVAWYLAHISGGWGSINALRLLLGLVIGYNWQRYLHPLFLDSLAQMPHNVVVLAIPTA